MQIGITIEHRKAIAMYREALGDPRAYPRIPQGCNTYWEHFTTVDGYQALIINQRAHARMPSDGDEELNGCSVAVAVDEPNAEQAKSMLDAWVRQMLPVSTAAAILGRRGGASTSPAKAAAARENAKKAGRPHKDGTPPVSRQEQ